MGSVSSFPVDLVLFGVVAAILVLRLRSILGRRTGFERSQPAAARTADPATANRAGPTIEGQAEPAAPPARQVPPPDSEIGLVLAQIGAMDPAFSPAAFLDGAERAFRMIVAAYATGDSARLRPLLGEQMFQAFEAAIGARLAAGDTQTNEIKAMPLAAYETAELRGGTIAELTVRFVTDQVNLTTDRDGRPKYGTDAVTEIIDLWTFERNFAPAQEQVWRLVAARSA